MKKRFLFFVLLLTQFVISSCKTIPKAENLDKDRLQPSPVITEKPKTEVIIEKHQEHAITEDKIKTPAFNFSLYDLEGNKISLSDFSGKPLILFFWTTWCPFCREEFPVLTDNYNDLKKEGIEVLAIDIGESKERVKKFTVNLNLDMPFPILLDSASTVAYAYDLLGVPTFILIDSQGKIKFQGNDFPGNYKQLLK